MTAPALVCPSWCVSAHDEPYAGWDDPLGGATIHTPGGDLAVMLTAADQPSASLRVAVEQDDSTITGKGPLKVCVSGELDLDAAQVDELIDTLRKARAFLRQHQH